MALCAPVCHFRVNSQVTCVVLHSVNSVASASPTLTSASEPDYLDSSGERIMPEACMLPLELSSGHRKLQITLALQATMLLCYGSSLGWCL